MKQEEIAGRVSLRPAAAADEELLVRVYASTRADELARVPWSEAQRAAFVRMQFDAQQLHYRTHNPAATYDVILLDGRAAGRLYVARRQGPQANFCADAFPGDNNFRRRPRGGRPAGVFFMKQFFAVGLLLVSA